MIVPSVTIAIATYARSKWLEEAIHSALLQSYPGWFEVLVLNDCPRQVFTCDRPLVRIINKSEHFPTLGDKRNYLLSQCSGDWIAFLDDDDVLMPWHLMRILKAVKAGKRTAGSNHSFFMDGDKGGLASSSLMDLAVERAFAISCGGFASLDNRDEHAFVANLQKLEPIFRDPSETFPSYVYMWGNGVHHISGTGDPYGGKGFRADAHARMDSGTEPTGVVALNPHWRRDYLQIVKDALQ